MRKNLTILIALLVAIAVAAPAMAAVEFKYGGQFRARWISTNNIVDGTNDVIPAETPIIPSSIGLGPPESDLNGNDHTNFVDQRLRLYFTFQSGENLKLVVKLEMGDTVWGDNGSKFGGSTGGRVGADAVNVELKNAYIDFAIPCTPTRAMIGIQGITLLDSATGWGGGWIVDDDFSAALLVTKLDPFTITVGYIAGQNLTNGTDLVNSGRLLNTDSDKIMDWTVAVDWACKPFKASLVWFGQWGHNTPVSVLPASLQTPAGTALSNTTSPQINSFYLTGTGLPSGMPFDWFGDGLVAVRNNVLQDVGFNFTYQVEWLKAYVNFVKNFGSVKTLVQEDLFTQFLPPFGDEKPLFRSHDYTGWMVDAGVYYYCGPWTFNVSGFYTTGQALKVNQDVSIERGFQFKQLSTQGNVNYFTYPLATTKYFSEIVGGGILDGAVVPGSFGGARYVGDGAAGTNFWTGYGSATNLWTVSVGTAWQVLPQTKLSLSWWYFGTAEPVMSKAVIDATGRMIGQKTSSSFGNEVDFYVTQGIYEGLTLDLVGAYMFTGDAYVNSWNGQFGGANSIAARNFSKDDAWKLGARLEWNF